MPLNLLKPPSGHFDVPNKYVNQILLQFKNRKSGDELQGSSSTLVETFKQLPEPEDLRVCSLVFMVVGIFLEVFGSLIRVIIQPSFEK